MAYSRNFTRTDFDANRWHPLRLVGITLTDKCPVGCKHCSVAATMTDRGPDQGTAFLEQVRQLAELSAVDAVFLTGGEPFLHVDVLADAVSLVRSAGKRVIVHTSGFWGLSNRIVKKAHAILPELSALVLGVDLYHRIGVKDRALQHVMSLSRSTETWLVIQVLNGANGMHHRAYARKMLVAALGADWQDYAELVENSPLRVGRALRLHAFQHVRQPLARCDLVNRPMLRFNGEVTACCNEAVLRGGGPSALRRAITTDVQSAMRDLAEDPLVQLVRAVPTATVYRVLAEVAGVTPEPTSSRCDACWRSGYLLQRMTSAQVFRARSLARLAGPID